MAVPLKHRHADQNIVPVGSGRPNQVQPGHMLSMGTTSAQHPLTTPGARPMAPGHPAVRHVHFKKDGSVSREPVREPRNHREAIYHPATSEELMRAHRTSPNRAA